MRMGLYLSIFILGLISLNYLMNYISLFSKIEKKDVLGSYCFTTEDNFYYVMELKEFNEILVYRKLAKKKIVAKGSWYIKYNHYGEPYIDERLKLNLLNISLRGIRNSFYDKVKIEFYIKSISKKPFFIMKNNCIPIFKEMDNNYNFFVLKNIKDPS